MIKSKDIANAMISMIEDDGKNPELVAESFFRFAEKYGLKGMTKDVLKKVEEFVAIIKNKNKVRVTFTRKEDEYFAEKVKKIIGTEKDAKVDVCFDEGMLGGFKAEYKNKMYNNSLVMRIDKLRDKLKKA